MSGDGEGNGQYLKFSSKLVRVVSIILVMIGLLFTLVIIVQQTFTPFKVISDDSMAPEIKAGDAIVISDVEPGKVRAGQIIVIREEEQKERYYTSRVIEIEKDRSTHYYVTRRDNGDISEQDRLPAGKVEGGIALRLPGFGGFIDFMASFKGFLLLVVAPIAAALLLSLSIAVLRKIHAVRSGKQGESPRDDDIQHPL